MKNINDVMKAIQETKTRSAWARGVKEYAAEMLEDLAFNIEHGYTEEEELCNKKLLERELLNGADNWSMYSWGGCSLIYDGDIAERLCTPSELKKTRNGERKPNSREEWLDTQARALFQASRMIVDAAF